MRTVSDALDELEPMVAIIRLAKELNDIDSRIASRLLNGLSYGSIEDEPLVYDEMLSMICDHYEVVTPDDDEENWDCTHLYFSDAVIREYMRLCREHSRVCGIEFDKDPHILYAGKLYDEWLLANGCYYCGYKALYDHEKDYGYGFYFYYDCSYFYEYNALIQRIAYLLQAFREAIAPLQREVVQLKRRTALAPVAGGILQKPA